MDAAERSHPTSAQGWVHEWGFTLSARDMGCPSRRQLWGSLWPGPSWAALGVLVGRGLCLGAALLFPHCSLGGVRRQGWQGKGHSAAGVKQGHWAPGQRMRDHSVGLTHHCSHMHTHTHPVCSEAHGLSHSPSLSHTWSQSKSESLIAVCGVGHQGRYSTKSENSTITRIPAQRRSTCCRECLWREGPGLRGRTR